MRAIDHGGHRGHGATNAVTLRMRPRPPDTKDTKERKHENAWNAETAEHAEAMRVTGPRSGFVTGKGRRNTNPPASICVAPAFFGHATAGDAGRRSHAWSSYFSVPSVFSVVEPFFSAGSAFDRLDRIEGRS